MLIVIDPNKNKSGSKAFNCNKIPFWQCQVTADIPTMMVLVTLWDAKCLKVDWKDNDDFINRISLHIICFSAFLIIVVLVSSSVIPIVGKIEGSHFQVQSRREQWILLLIIRKQRPCFYTCVLKTAMQHFTWDKCLVFNIDIYMYLN